MANDKPLPVEETLHICGGCGRAQFGAFPPCAAGLAPHADTADEALALIPPDRRAEIGQHILERGRADCGCHDEAHDMRAHYPLPQWVTWNHADTNGGHPSAINREHAERFRHIAEASGHLPVTLRPPRPEPVPAEPPGFDAGRP